MRRFFAAISTVTRAFQEVSATMARFSEMTKWAESEIGQLVERQRQELEKPCFQCAARPSDEERQEVHAALIERCETLSRSEARLERAFRAVTKQLEEAQARERNRGKAGDIVQDIRDVDQGGIPI